jgi:hypothetical protein
MRTLVLTFGRLNPCTTGHQKLVEKVKTVARLERGDAAVYLSHSQDAKKNPLDYSTKVRFAQKAFGKIVKYSTANTIIKVLKENENHYERIIMVVGSDRVDEFRKLLNDYNGKDYSYTSIEVVSAGDRDPDADDVSGMSASKMRKLVVEDDFETFKSGLPTLLRKDADKVFYELQKGMKIK